MVAGRPVMTTGIYKVRMQMTTIEEYKNPPASKETDLGPRKKSTVGCVLRFTTIDEDRDT
jgi:hypothetical protein